MKRNIALVGFRCTDKTFIGTALAKQLGLEFQDTDKTIEERAGKSIARIFAEDGEPAFRTLESDITAEACSQTDLVIAAGGGAVMDPRNRDNFTSNCYVVLLTADVDSILSRMEEDPGTAASRPALTDMKMRQEVEHLLSARHDAYHSVADIVVDTTQSFDAATQEIICRVRRAAPLVSCRPTGESM